MLDENDPEWQQLIDEILSGMAEWQMRHPKATFGEIELETSRRIAQLQVRIMEEIVQASRAADCENGESSHHEEKF